MPDEWVRQLLSQLPDTPPPSSSFDSARLWTQLRPEVRARPARRWVGWWLAAACLTGLVIGWLVWPLQNNEPKTAAIQQRQPDRLPGLSTQSKPMVEVREAAPVVVRTYQPGTQPDARPDQPVHRPADVTSVPEPTEPEPIAQVVEQPVLPVATPVVENLPEPHQANVAATTPKRRFRVMHENELRTEDEAVPKLYRTDSFVRLGTGQRSDYVTDNRQSALVMPLRIN